MLTGGIFSYQPQSPGGCAYLVDQQPRITVASLVVCRWICQYEGGGGGGSYYSGNSFLLSLDMSIYIVTICNFVCLHFCLFFVVTSQL